MKKFAEDVAGLEVVEGGGGGLPGGGFRDGEVGEDFEDFESACGGFTDLAIEVGLGGIELHGDLGPGSDWYAGEVGGESGAACFHADESASEGQWQKFYTAEVRRPQR